jgi:hypothetical protein
MQIAPNTQHSRPGRPVGSTIFDRDSLLKFAPEVYRKALDHEAGHPSQYTVASALGIGRATLNRYLVSYGISWGEIRQLALQKSLEMGAC